MAVRPVAVNPPHSQDEIRRERQGNQTVRHCARHAARDRRQRGHRSEAARAPGRRESSAAKEIGQGFPLVGIPWPSSVALSLVRVEAALVIVVSVHLVVAVAVVVTVRIDVLRVVPVRRRRVDTQPEAEVPAVASKLPAAVVPVAMLPSFAIREAFVTIEIAPTKIVAIPSQRDSGRRNGKSRRQRHCLESKFSKHLFFSPPLRWMCGRKRCLYLFVNFDVLLFMKMRSLPVTFVTFVVALSAHAQTLRFEEHTIAADLKGGYQVIAYDINHDGKPDLVALASGMTELVWFENPGWQRHVIASNLPHMINCALWDIDGDGIPEIVVAYECSRDASKSAGIVALLEHQGDPRQPWKVTEIDRLPTSHRLRWANIDGSGKKVVINAPLTDAQARAPEYRGHVPLVDYRPGEWKRHVISDEEEGVVHGIYVTDWDHTARANFLGAGFTGSHLYARTKAGA